MTRGGSSGTCPRCRCRRWYVPTEPRGRAVPSRATPSRAGPSRAEPSRAEPVRKGERAVGTPSNRPRRRRRRSTPRGVLAFSTAVRSVLCSSVNASLDPECRPIPRRPPLVRCGAGDFQSPTQSKASASRTKRPLTSLHTPVSCSPVADLSLESTGDYDVWHSPYILLLCYTLCEHKTGHYSAL